METETPPVVRPYLLPATVLVLFVAAFWPAVQLFVEKWSGSDDYTHAFFIVPIAAYMVWQKKECLTRPAGRPLLGLLFTLAAILFYLLALQIQVPTIIFLATVTTIVSIMICFGGFSVLTTCAIPVLLLFLVIPIPNQLLSMVTGALQLKVSQVSEIIITLFSVTVYREGNVIEIPGKAFQVVEACSGIRSLISLTTLSLIISYFTLSRVHSKVLLLLAAVPIAICVNVLRVTTLVLCYHYWRLDLAIGTPHTVMGLVLFGIGLGLLFGLQRILESWETKRTNS